MDIQNISAPLLSLATLTLLEIVLGIDNLVIISIITEKLPNHQKSKARKLGLSLALVMRILLLTTLSWLSHLTDPLLELLGREISVRDLVLIIGGVFLFLKAIKEIYNFAEAKDIEEKKPDLETKLFASQFTSVVMMIIFFDIIFSFDSVLTAVGLANQLWIMILAVIISMIFMVTFVNQVCDFIEKNPSIKLLALAFLVIIGFLLIAEGFHFHFDRNLVYIVMAFSISTELIGIRRRKTMTRRLHSQHK